MIASLAALVVASAPCDATDAHGHAFATCFDPWQGLELGGGLLLDSGQVSGSASAAVRLRGERESRSKAESTWLSLHRLGATEVRTVQGRFALSLVGYTGVFRRHVREGTLLLPFTPPVTIPFPLDMTFMAEALKYERRVADGSYVHREIRFDPRDDRQTRSVRGVDWTVDDRIVRVPALRSIPGAMVRPSWV